MGNTELNRIEFGPVLTVSQGVNPDKHTIQILQLCPHLVYHVIRIHCWFRMDVARSQCLKDAVEPAGLRLRATTCFAITTPQERQSANVFRQAAPWYEDSETMSVRR